MFQLEQLIYRFSALRDKLNSSATAVGASIGGKEEDIQILEREKDELETYNARLNATLTKVESENDALHMKIGNLQHTISDQAQIIHDLRTPGAGYELRVCLVFSVVVFFRFVVRLAAVECFLLFCFLLVILTICYCY